MYETTKQDMIQDLEGIIKNTLHLLELLHNDLNEGQIYYVEGYKGRTEVILLEGFTKAPGIRGKLLASKDRDPLDDPQNYDMWLKFIMSIKPFNKELAPLCINWGFVSPEFKRLFFQGD